MQPVLQDEDLGHHIVIVVFLPGTENVGGRLFRFFLDYPASRLVVHRTLEIVIGILPLSMAEKDSGRKEKSLF